MEGFISNEEHERKLALAREAARYAAYADLLELFGPHQRGHIANLMGHNWQITAVEFRKLRIFGNTPTDAERVEAANGPTKR